jgi:phosphate transport system substrate-binding protein
MKISFCKNGFLRVRKNLWRGASLILLGAVLAGCSGGNPSEKIIIRGSNTFGEELAPHLIAEFKKEHPACDFDSEFKGTSYGLGALMVGRCDVAAASRQVMTNELALSPTENLELKEYVIGSYAVAVVVNAGNAVANLTPDQARDIFTGAVQNWKDVGGADAPVHLYIRNPVSGTYLGFQELVMGKAAYGTHVKSFTDYKGICEAVAGDPNGIGYANFNMTRQTGIKPVSVGGIAPAAEAVNQGKYPYARTLRLYTNKANEPADAAAFAQFVQSPAGQKIVGEMGYVPKP